MSAEKYTIGLDFGTLSGRGVLVRCSDGVIFAEEMKEYSHGVMSEFLPDGETGLGAEWALEHPADYLEVLEWVVPVLMKRTGIDPDDVVGIGIDFTSCTMFPVDADAVPLCMKDEFRHRRNAYAKLWKHHGAKMQAERINQVLKEKNLETDVRFGGKCSTELMLPKVLEVLDEDPAMYDAACEFLEAGDWLTRVLTGSGKRSCSMAGYKMWWNEEAGYPEEDFFAAVDERLRCFIREKAPGEMCPMGSCIGLLNEEWAGRLGLCSGIPVAPAIIDSHAGVPGSGVGTAAEMMLVLGTSSVLIALSKTAYSGKGIMGGVRDAVVPGFYAYESGLASVGDLFAWFVDNMLPWSIKEEAERHQTDVFAVLNAKAQKLRPGESGILALDWWNGNKTPYVDASLQGCFFGMTLKTKPEELYLALIEATAFATRMILELYEEHGVKANTIVASGGIARKNPFIMQIYADVLGKEIRVAGSSQAAALGSAIYASLAAGEQNGGFGKYEEAVAHMCPGPSHSYTPDMENRQVYNRLYKRYCTLARVMGEEYRDILEK